MRIAILGAGPAGLYLAYLIKRRRADAHVTLIEQNPANATFGFGVVFSDRALEFLRDDDPESYAAIAPQMESWTDMTLVHRNERVTIDGVGFAAIGRLKLLQLLQERVRAVGIEPQFGRAVASLNELADADLIVGADGVNSLVRQTFADQFGASVTYGSNRFAWFGTATAYDTLTQTFRQSAISTRIITATRRGAAPSSSRLTRPVSPVPVSRKCRRMNRAPSAKKFSPTRSQASG